MTTSRPCPAHTPPARPDLAYPASTAAPLGPTQTVLVEFVEETRHRVHMQIPAGLALDDIEAALPNLLATSPEDGFIDFNRYIEHVEILPAGGAVHGGFAPLCPQD